MSIILLVVVLAAAALVIGSGVWVAVALIDALSYRKQAQGGVPEPGTESKGGQ